MAIIYDAILVPGKLDIIGQWLDSQPWAGSGALTQLGSYRFDDPAGEVGIEAMVLRRGERALHVPVTYRSGPLEGGEDALLGTIEHSVLGRRWVYDATADPVAVACYARALQGSQDQAVHEIWEGQTLVEVREPSARLRLEGGSAGGAESAAQVRSEGVTLRIARVLDEGLDGPRRLVAAWDGGTATVAALVEV